VQGGYERTKPKDRQGNPEGNPEGDSEGDAVSASDMVMCVMLCSPMKLG